MPLLSGGDEEKRRYTVIGADGGAEQGMTDQVLSFRGDRRIQGLLSRLDRPGNSRNGYLKAAALANKEMEENVLAAYIIDIGKLRATGERREAWSI